MKEKRTHTQTHTHTCSQCSQCISCFQVLSYCLFFSNAESTCALTLNPVAFSMFFMFSFSYFSCVVSPHLDVTKKCDTQAVQLRAVAEILPEHQWRWQRDTKGRRGRKLNDLKNIGMKLQKRSSKNQTHHQMLDFRLQEKRAEAFIWRGETTTPQSFQAS